MLLRIYFLLLFLISQINLFSDQDQIMNQFIYNNCVRIFRNLNADEKIIQLWLNNTNEMSKILSSEMVQGMKDGLLTKKEFDKLYMKPDVLYIYNLGLALKDRADYEKNSIDKENIMLIANMFMGYQNKHQKFEKLGLKLSDKLNDKRCKDHSDLLSKKLNINEYYLAILTDMMPYVCFANYLYNTIPNQETNPWMEYAKKYGKDSSEYVNEKLRKSISFANNAIEKIPEKKAEEIFQEGMSFESYFIEEAMNGNLLKKINNKREKFL